MKDVQTLIVHLLERAEPEEVIGLEPREHLPLLDDVVHRGDHLRVLGLLVSLWKSGNKKILSGNLELSTVTISSVPPVFLLIQPI